MMRVKIKKKNKKRRAIEEKELGEGNEEFIEEIGEIRKNILGSDNDASLHGGRAEKVRLRFFFLRLPLSPHNLQ